MKMRIYLALHDGRSSRATIDDSDGLEIEISSRSTPKAACLKAAKVLRDAANKFELLSNEPAPFNCETHDRINRTKLTPNV